MSSFENESVARIRIKARYGVPVYKCWDCSEKSKRRSNYAAVRRLGDCMRVLQGCPMKPSSVQYGEGSGLLSVSEMTSRDDCSRDS